jgi:hypothetical protein
VAKMVTAGPDFYTLKWGRDVNREPGSEDWWAMLGHRYGAFAHLLSDGRKNDMRLSMSNSATSIISVWVSPRRTSLPTWNPMSRAASTRIITSPWRTLGRSGTGGWRQGCALSPLGRRQRLGGPDQEGLSRCERLRYRYVCRQGGIRASHCRMEPRGDLRTRSGQGGRNFAASLRRPESW